jgi:hypothetical protein
MLSIVDKTHVTARPTARREKENNMSALALRMTKDATMIPEFDAGGFINLSREQRIAKCRQMATEAERLAAGKSAEMRASYLDLARKWSDLANEMESIGEA